MSALKHFGKFLLAHLNIATDVESLNWEEIQAEYENFKRGQQTEMKQATIEINRPGLMYINWVVADHFNEDAFDIRTFTKTRKREKVQARQIGHYIAYKIYRYSCQTVGDFYGKDHSTIIHSCKTVINLMETDKYYKQEVNKIIEKLNKDDRTKIESNSAGRSVENISESAVESI